MEAQRQFCRCLKEKFQGKQAVWKRRLKEEEKWSSASIEVSHMLGWAASEKLRQRRETKYKTKPTNKTHKNKL